MTLVPGSRLGPYEILTLLGSGGMGEVYRAHDPRLGRDVAIKVLPAALSGDPDRLRRFEQEARAAAALNHPNILTVHEIGAAGGAPYVVSELLEGETLRETLARGPLSSRSAVGYALQVLSGLAAAHDKGIVHRDLKPENLFVTADDRVKILDFGLAKLLEPAAGVDDASILATRAADTTAGVVLGTIAYMSPEQVRGHAVDHRSDLFSFGAILYEMLSGERPFQGDSPADTISTILRGEPRELSVAAGGQVSPVLERIVRRCLEKEPGRRVQSARDLAFDLESLSALQDTSIADRSPRGSRRWGRRELVSAAGLGMLCGGLGVWLTVRIASQPAADTPRVQHVSRMTRDVGFSEWPTWSPDGRTFAFSSNRTGQFDIYLGRIDGGQEAVPVTRNAADNVQPAFSPDGASIAFVSTRSSRTQLTKIATYSGSDFRTYGGDIWWTPVFGGQARLLAENGNFPVWNPNGRSVAYVSGAENRRTISEATIDGGSPRPVLAAATSTWEIERLAYSPNGRWITFETTEGQVLALPAAGGTPTGLLSGRAHAWAPNGQRMYYVAPEAGGATQIEAADVGEGSKGLAVSNPRIVGTNTGAMHQLAVAPDGLHLLAAEVEESVNLSRVPLAPAGDDVAGPEEALSTGQLRDIYPSVSPDEKRILVGSNRVGQQELWTLELASGKWQRVQMPRQAYDGVTGCWSGDPGHVFAVTILGGMATLWSVAVDGSRTAQLVPPTPGGPTVRSLFPCAVSPNGRTVTYPRLAGAFTQLVLLDIPSRRERPLTTSASHKYEATWSPDGRWIAFSANTGGSVNVWRIPAGGGLEQQLTTGFERVRHLFYSPNDGRWLYVQPNHRNIYRMPADGGPRQAVTHFPDSSSLFIEEPTISPDGRYLVYSRGHGGSSIWMLTLNVR